MTDEPVKTPQVWQIACGEAGRRYDHLFLKHDVMFLGPGDYGEYNPSDYEDGPGGEDLGSRGVGEIRRFATEVETGDVVLLRSGYRVLALGTVSANGYGWSESFDDVYGWDLQHTQRVVWQYHLSGRLSRMQAKRDLFASRKQIPTFTRVEDPAIRRKIDPLIGLTRDRGLKRLPPKPSPVLSLEEFAEGLFHQGLSTGAVRQVCDAIQKQRRLLDWYWETDLAPDRPSEHEVVAHLVLPIMRALGWSEQQLAVEWHRIDMAVFKKTPTDEKHCTLVCEAKGMGRGLQDAFMQAQLYCTRLRLTGCRKILLTDGGRFYLYRKVGSRWGDEASGYLNVLKLRERYLCPSGCNAVDTLMALTPTHI